MKYMIMITALTLAACQQGGVVDRLAPQTAAGYRAGGIVGGLDGMSGAVIAVCERADGERFRVAVDTLGEATGGDDLVDRVRARRVEACAIAGGARLVMEASVAES